MQEGANSLSLRLLFSLPPFTSKDGLVNVGLRSMTQVGEGLVAEAKEVFTSSAVSIRE